MKRTMMWTCLGGALGGLFGCGSSPPAETPAGGDGGPPKVVWEERFAAKPPQWGSPSRASAEQIDRVFSIVSESGESFLRARHDATPGSDPPPAVHWGMPWKDNPLPLAGACSLSWRWRVRQHPKAAEDPWQDVAASVYVVMKTPGLLSDGRGFKFGWLAKPGPEGTKQRGLVQIQLRAEPAGDTWYEEKVDLCSLLRSHYNKSPSEEKLAYIGVVTDADNTESIAEADYDDFVLESR